MAGATGAVDNSADRGVGSWVGFFVFWAVAAAAAIPLFGTALPPGVRLALSGLFVVVGVTVALLVDVFKVDFFVRTTDRGPFDWYTLAHCLAGVMLGGWFLPIWFVLLVTIAWEIFEATVKGWGMYEPIGNRVIDVAVAAFGWLIVTGITALVQGGTLPLLVAKGSLLAGWIS